MKKCIYLLIILLVVNLSSSNVYSQDILSKPTSSESQCKQWLKDKNAEQELIDLVPFIFKESIKAKVDPTLVIAQTSLETNYFKSDLCKSNKNTAGIKRRGDSNKYAKYDSYKEGLKAQIAHLALYAGNPQNWYYYTSWLDGWVTNVEKLSGTWAEDKNYSKKLLQMMNQIYSYESKCEPIIDVEEQINNNDNTYKNKIYEILNRRNSDNSKGVDIINKILRRK